jgi:hypothetical protein
MYREYVSGVSPAYCLVMIVVLYTTGADVNGRLVPAPSGRSRRAGFQHLLITPRFWGVVLAQNVRDFSRC